MSDTEQKLQPCLAELLRTCIKPSSVVLQIDGIVTQETTVDSGNRASAPAVTNTIRRFHLTDGELFIQALLQPILLADYDLNIGDCIEVRDFAVRKAKRLNGNGKVIYMNVQDFSIVGQHQLKDRNAEGGFIKSDQEEHIEPLPKKRKRNTNRVAFAGLPDPSEDGVTGKQLPKADLKAPSRPQNGSMPTNKEVESEDEFESLDINISQLQQRRQTLRTIQEASAPTISTANDSKQPKTPSRHNDEPEEQHNLADSTYDQSPENLSTSPATSPSIADPSLPNHNPQPLTPPYHALSSLLSPHLPPKNYPLTTLAIITYLSSTLLSKPNSPFPPKRNIRILDTSLSDDPTHPHGLSLAVYVDAKSFLPAPGTIALFRGIVMQKFGREIILNAYATLKDKPANEQWYIDDEQTLETLGFDVKGMRRWWEERVKKNAKKSIAT